MTAAPTPDGPLLQAERLSKSFGGVRALSDVDFSMDRGELRWLLGPNGAGKSTLFALISGLHSCDSGRILFEDQDITRLAPHKRVRRGLCQKFQTTRIYRGMSVGQNLLLARGHWPDREEKNERLRWALAALKLDEKANLPAAALPHTHQQWLEICLALAAEPELLLLDEPTAGMTPEETALTGEFLKALNGRGLAILIVEHDMTFVRQIGGRVSILHFGRMFREGTLDEIEGDPDVRRIYIGET